MKYEKILTNMEKSFKQAGISVSELQESGRKIRERLVVEKYGRLIK